MTYLKKVFLSAVTVLITVGLVNWFIDPFGMYWSPQLKHINQKKPKAGTRSRVTKAYQAQDVSPKILLVGNSRIEMGINPKSEFFGNKSTYNLGIRGAGIAMQVDYAIEVIESSQQLEQIIASVDFLDFLTVPSIQDEDADMPSYSFRLNSLSSANLSTFIARSNEKLAMIFSLNAFIASLKTIAQQHLEVDNLTPLGFNTADSFVKIMRSEGIKPLFQQKIAEISNRMKDGLVINVNSSFPYSNKFKHLERLINTARNNNVKLTIFINPYHYSYLYTIDDRGQWQNFEQWKRTLVTVVEDSGKGEIELWDFSGITSYIMDPVDINTPNKHLKWFWEPAHYNSKLGELVLEKIHDKNSAINNFGKKLTRKNITQTLTWERILLEKHRLNWIHLKANLLL
ncbi:hypothetical protein [Thalassotalea ganghwensis]